MTHALLLIFYGSLILAVIVGLTSAANEPWEGIRLPLVSAGLAFVVVWALVIFWLAVWMVAQGVIWFMLY